MAATEKETQAQLISTMPPLYTSSLLEFSTNYYEIHRRCAFEDLLIAVGSGRRLRAQESFCLRPDFLTHSGKLTDSTKTTYPSMSLIGYAVMKKDTYLIEKVITFLGSYEAKKNEPDKNTLIKTIVQEFKTFFNKEMLDSIKQFVDACANFNEMPRDTEEEKEQRHKYFIENIGGLQRNFEASIIHLYCNGYLTEVKDLSNKELEEDDGIKIRRGPEIIPTNFYLERSRDYVLISRWGIAYGYTQTNHFFGGVGIELRHNAEMLIHWDKLQTKVLESQLNSLELMLTSEAKPVVSNI